MVGANLERLVAPHHHPDQLGLLVLQHPQITRSPLLPLVGIRYESEQLGPHLEDDILVFLVGGDVDLFRQLDDGLVVRVVVVVLVGGLRQFGQSYRQYPRFAISGELHG